jgi:phenylalanyl-tRNA synthetase alpha chain
MTPPLSGAGVGDDDEIDLPQRLLNYLDNDDHTSLDSLNISSLFNIDHQRVIGAINSLLSIGDVCLHVICSDITMCIQVIVAEQTNVKRLELTTEGREIAEHGSHEARLFAAVPSEGILQTNLMVTNKSIINDNIFVEIESVCQSWL